MCACVAHAPELIVGKQPQLDESTQHFSVAFGEAIEVRDSRERHGGGAANRVSNGGGDCDSREGVWERSVSDIRFVRDCVSGRSLPVDLV